MLTRLICKKLEIPYVLYVSVSSSYLVSSNPFYFLENGKSNKQRLPLPPPPVSIPYETSYLDDGANEQENAETDVFEEEQGLCHLI